MKKKYFEIQTIFQDNSKSSFNELHSKLHVLADIVLELKFKIVVFKIVLFKSFSMNFIKKC